MASWSQFEDAPDLRKLAEKVRAARWDVAHVNLDEVLFLWEVARKPNAYGECYSLVFHPIRRFCPARFAIVFYRSLTSRFDEKQLAILMWHEMKHIPMRGDKLVDHDMKDFTQIIGTNWTEVGADVPDILTDTI